jgi:hypothetical protein
MNPPVIHQEDRKHSLTVQIAVLAHEVVQSPTGNIDIRGVFNSIGASGFPAAIPRLTLLVRVHYGRSSATAAPKETIFRFSDLDGPLHEFRCEALFPVPPNGSLWAVSDNAVTLNNFPIEAAGEYWFEFWMDGHQLCTLPLVAALVPPGQFAPPGTPGASAP